MRHVELSHASLFLEGVCVCGEEMVDGWGSAAAQASCPACLKVIKKH